MPKTKISSVLQDKGALVHSVSPNTSVLDMLTLMAKVNVGALVVLDQGKIVGIVSERDYARKIALSGKNSAETKVADIMSVNVICAAPEQTIDEVMSIMTQKGIRHLPIIQEEQLIGIISIGDLVKKIIRNQEVIIRQLETYIQGH